MEDLNVASGDSPSEDAAFDDIEMAATGINMLLNNGFDEAFALFDKYNMSSKKRMTYTEEAMQAACRSVKENGKSLREAGKLYGVPHSTLKDRLKGVPSNRSVQRTVISAEDEARVAAWIKESARRGFGKTKSQVTSTVQEILKGSEIKTPFKDNKPGRKWVKGFLKRHQDISVRTPQALGSQRAFVTEDKVRGWFETAYNEISAVDADVLNHPSRIFNCDESGFQLGGGVRKVLGAKGDKHIYQISSDTHQQITVLACCNAAGDSLEPLIVYPGQRFNYDPLAGFPSAHFARSPKGWIDGDIFFSWMKTVFVPSTDGLTKPVVLFADGHTTHVTMTVSELCRDHNIILYQLPSHASHLVQPLDLTTFRTLKHVWREEVLNYQEENCDILGKKDFSYVFKKTWERGIRKDVVISGFRAAGIYPWNPDSVDYSKLGPSRLFTLTDNDARVDSRETATTETGDSRGMTVTEREENTRTRGTTEITETTVTGDNTETIVTADNAIFPLSPHLSLNPPSPTVPTVLPALPPGPLADQNSTCDISSATSLPRQDCVSGVSSAILCAPRPSSTTVSSSSSSFDPSPLESLDRLLDLTAKVGVEGLIHYRAMHDLKASTDNLEAQQFCQLYSTLRLLLKSRVDTADQSIVRRTLTFDSLTPPSQWKPKQKRSMIQPPKMVSSQKFRDFIIEGEMKKKKEADEKERKKIEREEKKRNKEEVEKKKKQETERKRKEREEKHEKAKSKRSKAKRRKTNMSESQKESMISSMCVDSDNDYGMELTDICVGCMDCEHDEYDRWIECSVCKFWYHMEPPDPGCMRDESLRGKSMDEIEKMVYQCLKCKKKVQT